MRNTSMWFSVYKVLAGIRWAFEEPVINVISGAEQRRECDSNGPQERYVQ